jgi:UDP-N-acetylmuramoyl-L-alanyl-D-glutamate--2,6-diaminopimelate ligase
MSLSVLSHYLQVANEIRGSKIIECLSQEDLLAEVGGNFSELSFDSIVAHSGRVSLGQAPLFCALSGSVEDGRRYVNEAILNGARGLVLELDGKPFDSLPSEIPFLLVRDPRKAVSSIAALATDYVSRAQNIIGITGTNGKTTSAHLILRFFELLGVPGASIGTLGVQLNSYGGGVSISGDLTTPDALALNGWCRELFGRGVKHICMEVSSHALTQKRAADINISVGIFTNLTQDHLDYHASIEEYAEAKYLLFRFPSLKSSIINYDDSTGRLFVERLRVDGRSVITVGTDPACEYRILETRILDSKQFIRSNIRGQEYSFLSPLLGPYNVYNLLGVLAACEALGFPLELLVSVIPDLSQAPGRLERFEFDGKSIYVDYAHTPDAIANVLGNVRTVTKNNVWVVFGCGGDRDRSKRPKMLQVARDTADRVVVTMDNPRTEDPKQIVADMVSSRVIPDMIEYDRRKAIRYALESAADGDSIVIAGKGHEDYQIVGNEKLPFSDQSVVQEFIAERSRGIKNFT